MEATTRGNNNDNIDTKTIAAKDLVAMRILAGNMKPA
jgi:hypothetical protein